MADNSQYKNLNLVMAAMTDKLADKLEKMGQWLVDFMNDSNSFPDTVTAYEAEDKMDGILFVLTTLNIPHKVFRHGERDTYTAFEIAGRMFYVNSGAAAEDGE